MKRLLILALAFSVIGCKEPIDKNFHTIKDNYKIGYHGNPAENIFVKHNIDMDMMVVLVNKKIKRLGFNDRFAIIERVGNYGDLDTSSLDTLVVRYYVVDMTKQLSISNKDYLFGPSNYDEFLTRKMELGIEELDFTKEFDVD